MSDHNPKLIVCICPGNADSLAQDRCTGGGCVKSGVCVDCPVHEEAPEEELPRLAGVTVSARWLSRLFIPGETERLNSGLPEGAKYRYSFFDPDAQAVVLVYEHPSFLPSPEGAPLVRLNYDPDQWIHNNFTGEIVIVNHAFEPEMPDGVMTNLVAIENLFRQLLKAGEPVTAEIFLQVLNICLRSPERVTGEEDGKYGATIDFDVYDERTNISVIAQRCRDIVRILAIDMVHAPPIGDVKLDEGTTVRHFKLYYHAAKQDIEPEFHETLPPDWVPPELIRLWDAADPDARKAMKNRRQASEDDLQAQSAILAQIVAKEGEEE